MKKTDRIVFYCTKEEKEMIEKSASEDMRPVASYVLNVVKKHIKEQEDENGS